MVTTTLRERIEKELPGWHIEGSRLVGRWALRDFSAALAAAVQIGLLAERADHHPDLELGWGFLRVALTTHSTGSITEKDLELATSIQTLLGSPA